MNTSLYERLKGAKEMLIPVSETPRLDVEVLFAHSLGTTRERLILDPPKAIERETIVLFSHLIQERSKGKPVAYIVGNKNFFENDFIVNEHVLIPRPDTEQLVEEAIQLLLSYNKKPTLLDIGTGSGCIPISIARYVPDTRIVASDSSRQALAVATLNAKLSANDAHITFVQSDMLTSIPRMHYNLITANLPYLPTHEALAVTRRYGEPFEALNGGFLGYELYQKFFSQLSNFSFDNILLECDPRHVRQLSQITKDFFPQVRVKVYFSLKNSPRGIQIERIKK